jgi:hypothetical protein
VADLIEQECGVKYQAHVWRVFDFTLGTHPIRRKGTSELGGAKRRSALGLYLH